MSNVRNKAISAVVWSAIERLSGQLIRFVIGIILARLLTPAEFGLIGMLAVFLAVTQVFVNCGFGEALIQKSNATHQDESSVFYFNVVLGILGTLVLYFAAPGIARFYGQPALVGLVQLLAVVVVINSFGVVQTMLLTKRIDFKTQVKISIFSTVASGAVAVAMAMKGFGVISLVAQYLIGDLLRVLLLWMLHGWRPSLSFSLASLRGMFPFGSRMFASGFLNAVFEEAYSVVIGKLYEPATLGLFTRARQLQQLPVGTLCGIVGRVSFPVFASIQQDKVLLKRGVKKALKGLAWINFPMMVGLAVTSRPLVLVLLTEKWVACVPFVQLLCVGGMLFPLSLIHLSALSAQGRSDLFLRLEIIKKVMIVLSIALTFRYGVEGLLVGSLVVNILSYFLNGYYSVRLIHYAWKEQIHDLLPYLGISAFMGACVWMVGLLPLGGDVSRLVVQVVTGFAVYSFCCWFWRVSSFVEGWTALSSRLPRWKAA